MDRIIDITKVKTDLANVHVNPKECFPGFNFSSTEKFFYIWLNFSSSNPFKFKKCSIRRRYFAKYNENFIVDDKNILVVKTENNMLISSNNFKKEKKYIYAYRKLRRILIDRGMSFEFKDSLNDYFIPLGSITGNTIKEMKNNEKEELKKALKNKFYG